MERLPETLAILCAANLTIHENVSRIVLYGSRGLKNCFRSNSDIDLSLIADLNTGVDINLLNEIFHIPAEPIINMPTYELFIKMREEN